MPKRHKVLITGSSGMLGIDLCQELASGYYVMGMDLVRSPKSKLKKFIKCDITDKKGVQEAIGVANPDIVIHCAAWTNVDGCELDSKKAYEINADGSGNVALACNTAGSILVYISTDFVFNGDKKTYYRETDKPKPLSIYGDSKLKGERAIIDTLDRYIIVRTSWLYGENGNNFVDTIIAKAKTERSLKVVRDQVGSPTYAKHLAKAIHRLLDRLTIDHRPWTMDYGIYHVSNSGKVSWYNYTKEILRLAKLKTKVVPITSDELNRPAERPSMSAMDNSKFIKLTGYRMPGWKIALKDYLANKR